jgi:hypothetical protein
MYKDAQPAGTAYGLVYPMAKQGTLLPHTPVRDPQFRISINIYHRLKPVYNGCRSQYRGQCISVDSGTYYVSSFLSFLVSTMKLASFMLRI